jgi:hypothetical protein
MNGMKRVTVILVLLWAGLFAASIYFAMQVEGPRNIDTGFKRLNVLASYQALAFAVAVVAAVAGIVARQTGRRIMLVGFVPLIVTGLIVVGFFVVASLEPRTVPDSTVPPPKPTAPAIELPPVTD